MAATIKSVEKAIDLLFLFDGDRTVMDVKTIAARLGIPLRTTYRLANTLRQRNVITIEEGTGLCRVSPRLRRLLAAIDDSGDVARLSEPFLAALARASGETAQLFLPHRDEVILVETAESPQALRVGPRRGQHIPLHCGAGAQAVLAFQQPEEWTAYVRRNPLKKKHAPNTLTDPAQLIRRLERIRRSGFAVSHQEFVPGVRSLAVPIRDATGRVVGSLGLVGPDSRLTTGRARELKEVMQQTAALITRALGGQ
ncbi:MAG: IclR family transcriptional regulator [Candidatus Methylomirabilales bacterium]